MVSLNGKVQCIMCNGYMESHLPFGTPCTGTNPALSPRGHCTLLYPALLELALAKSSLPWIHYLTVQRHQTYSNLFIMKHAGNPHPIKMLLCCITMIICQVEIPLKGTPTQEDVRTYILTTILPLGNFPFPYNSFRRPRHIIF